MAVSIDERAALLDAIRALGRDRIAPLSREADERSEFPQEWLQLFRDNGIYGLCFDEDHGGTGTGTLLLLQAIEELSKWDASAGLLLAVQELGALPIKLAGTPEQRERWEPRWASGEAVAAYCLTEAEAGSDAASLRATARRDGDHWVLDGTKRFISNAGIAQTYVVFARTGGPGPSGISAFMVESDDPGCSIGSMEHKLGIRASPTGEVVLEDCRIPADRLIGEEGEGFRLAMRVLDRSRPGIAAQALGIAQGAIDYALAYARERVTFGKPITAHQGIQFMFADMQTQTDAARVLLYKVGAMIDDGAGDPTLTRFSAMAKLHCSDTAMAVTTDAVQILGGYGYSSDYPLERMMRDAKITQIYEGTNQIQRIVIAREMLAGR